METSPSIPTSEREAISQVWARLENAITVLNAAYNAPSIVDGVIQIQLEERIKESKEHLCQILVDYLILARQVLPTERVPYSKVRRAGLYYPRADEIIFDALSIAIERIVAVEKGSGKNAVNTIQGEVHYEMDCLREL